MSILTLASIFCAVPALIVLFFGRFENSRPAVRDISILVISFLLIDILCMILAKAAVNNLPFFHLVTALELFIFGKIFWQNCSGLKKKIIQFTTFVGLGLLVINIFCLETLLEFNSVARSVQAIVLLFFAVIWFIEVFQNMKQEKLSNDPILYVTTGVLLYFTGNAVIFGLYTELLESHVTFLKSLWDVHSLLNIVLNLLLAIALFKMQDKPKEIVVTTKA